MRVRRRTAMQGTTGTARHIHLTRAARTAGEAFAFVDAEPQSSTRPAATVFIWAGLGIVAAGALLIGF
jgi:hypothetical protein